MVLRPRKTDMNLVFRRSGLGRRWCKGRAGECLGLSKGIGELVVAEYEKLAMTYCFRSPSAEVLTDHCSSHGFCYFDVHEVQHVASFTQTQTGQYQVKAGYADIPRDVLKGINLVFQPVP